MFFLRTATCLGVSALLSVPASAAVISRLQIDGSPGDGLTNGASVLLDGERGRFSTLVQSRVVVNTATFELTTVPYGISVFYSADDVPRCAGQACVARLDLSAPQGANGLALMTGSYANASLAGGANPGLDLTLGSGAFTTIAGAFTITDLAFVPTAPFGPFALDRLAATFTLRGDANLGAVSGQILINQPAPIPEPAALPLLLAGLAGLATRRAAASDVSRRT